MPHIKYQKLVYNADGTIKSGSAAIVDTVYDSKRKGKCYHPVREKLGRVIWVAEDKRSGIFLSPTRGLLAYNADQDQFSDVDRGDSRISDTDLFPDPVIHTVFGDSYLLLCFLEKCGLMAVLRDAFSKNEDYERVLAHILHTVLKNSSRISCDDFMEKSFASYIFTDIPITSLGSDTVYFRMMGKDQTRLAFFQSFVTHMRKKDPKFGRGCYVDSTPLPNDIHDNPFNALCSHGVASTSIQTRLVLILDQKTGLPVWYQIMPGNVLDFSTIMTVMSDVAESLDIRIDELVLDAGYVNKDLITAFNIDTKPYIDEDGESIEKYMTARMPAKNGYPFKTLYHSVKSLIHNAKYEFIRQGHSYFGYRKEEVIFGCREYTYVYVDKDNALELSRNYQIDHEKEYQALKDKDKNWYSVKFGYFVLVSNKKKEPDEMLDDYYGRTKIENVFKTSKEYLDLLPLSKWTDQAVRGKILSDIISTIVLLEMRKRLAKAGLSTTKLIGKTQSLMCMKKSDGTILVETPNKQVRQFYQDLSIPIPGHFKLKQFRSDTVHIQS